jgi:hypothetical protein
MRPDQILIRPKGTRRGIIVDLLGHDAPSGGVGGWEAEQAGKKKRPVLRWAGRPGHEQTIVVMIDGFDTNTSVEATCRRLGSWGRGRKDTPPPRLQVTGRYLRSPANVAWVITGLEWGDQIRRGDGRRIQQVVTLTLSEWNKAPQPPPKKAGTK